MDDNHMKKEPIMQQAKVLNVAMVGGGPGCKAIMDIIFAEKLRQLRMNLIGIADIDPTAVGYRYAQEKGVLTTKDYRDFYGLKELNMIIELTGRKEVANEISLTKPDHVRFMDHVAARLFWDVFQVEQERIAERQRAERAWREEGRFLRTVFDAIQDGVTVVDCELNIIQVNRWVEKTYATQMPLIGKKCYKAYQGRQSPCPWCPSLPTLATGEVHSEVVPYPVEENPTRWIDLSAFPLKNPHGRVVGVIEYMKDITQRKQVEEDLRESEAQKRAILDASIDTIRYVDRDMRIIWTNRRTTDVLGVAPEDIAGQTCYELFVGRDTPCEGCPTKKALATGEIERAVMHKPHVAIRQGESYWDCYAVPLKDESGQITRLIQVARDVTDQKQAEKELKRKHDELQAINGVLLRMTKEYNLNGMCRVLQDMMEDFYPGFEAWIFLLTPDRDSFYFPRPNIEETRETCYDRAERKIRSLELEESLFQLLTREEVMATCSRRKRGVSPATIKELAAGFRTWMAVPIGLEGECHGLFVLGSPHVNIEMDDDLIFVEALIRQISGVIRYQISKEVREEAFRKQLTGRKRSESN
jgi:PAS domain S-box-containing protein